MTTPWHWLPVAVLSAPAYATTYLTVEHAQQLIFPGATLTPAPVTLTDAQLQSIEQLSAVRSTHADIHAWRVSSGGFFLVDTVLGKHDLITFALGINGDGSIREIEILDYREQYGGEIRSASWRNQFVRKTVADPLKLDQDIRNISGATLSSRHVTDAVRRLMVIYALILK
jgi:FMN-binding protein